MEVVESRDGKIRTISIECRNFKENCKRITRRSIRDVVMVYPVDDKRVTRRSIRDVVMVYPVDETSILQELGDISMIADLMVALNNTVNF